MVRVVGSVEHLKVTDRAYEMKKKSFITLTPSVLGEAVVEVIGNVRTYKKRVSLRLMAVL
jgi:hypothetical protein